MQMDGSSVVTLIDVADDYLPSPSGFDSRPRVHPIVTNQAGRVEAGPDLFGKGSDGNLIEIDWIPSRWGVTPVGTQICQLYSVLSCILPFCSRRGTIGDGESVRNRSQNLRNWQCNTEFVGICWAGRKHLSDQNCAENERRRQEESSHFCKLKRVQ